MDDLYADKADSEQNNAVAEMYAGSSKGKFRKREWRNFKTLDEHSQRINRARQHTEFSNDISENIRARSSSLKTS